jgi:hypothetical protein
LTKCRQKNEEYRLCPDNGSTSRWPSFFTERPSLRENKSLFAAYFVNPAQFNDASDFKKYPSTIDEDISKLETNDCDIYSYLLLRRSTRMVLN